MTRYRLDVVMSLDTSYCLSIEVIAQPVGVDVDEFGRSRIAEVSVHCSHCAMWFQDSDIVLSYGSAAGLVAECCTVRWATFGIVDY